MKKAQEYLLAAYSEYKVIIWAYVLLAAFIALLYPPEFAATLFNSRSTVLFSIIRRDTLIIFPLVVLGLLLITRKSYGKHIPLKETLIATAVLLFFSFFITTLLEVIFNGANPDRIAFWSQTFMNADVKIFGTYPAFWMFHYFPFFLQVIVVYVYENFHLLISLWITFLLLYKKGVYAPSFIKRFFLAFVVCFPLWILFPTISPAQMYINNILKAPIEQHILQAINVGPPNEFTNFHVNKVFRMWTDPESRFFATSNFPSMHTIWGILLAYSAYRISRKRWVLAVTAILALLNAIGAVYLLPHYAVDILAGIIIAVLLVKIRFKNE